MPVHIAIPDNADRALLQRGLTLSRAKGFFPAPDILLEDGSLRLRARVQDSFHFVDHPQVVLDPTGTSVSHFQCDCPEYRASRSFCVHCAALVAERIGTPILHGPARPNPVLQAEAAPVLGDPAGPSVLDFSYRFANAAWDLYPDDSIPMIPEERFYQVFGHNARARHLFLDEGEWGGSCFGFVSSTTLMHQSDCPLALTDFRDGAQLPSELELQDRSSFLQLTLMEFIEAMQILQYSPMLRRSVSMYNMDAPCLDKLAQRVRDFASGTGDPVVMGMISDKGGHAVLPFRIESVDSSTDRLHIYDPNYPQMVRYAALEKNDRGEYVNWRFPMTGSEDYSGQAHSILSLFPYEAYKLAWENSGISGSALLSADWGAEVWDEKGALVASAINNTQQAFTDDIYPMLPLGKPNRRPSFTLPAGGYTVKNQQVRQQTVRMADLNLSLDATAETRVLSASVSDDRQLAAVHIPVPRCPCTVRLLDTGVQPQVTYTLEDTPDGELQLLYQKGQLYADGLSQNARLFVNGEGVEVSRYIRPLVCEQPQEEAPQEEEQLILNAPRSEDTQPQD